MNFVKTKISRNCESLKLIHSSFKSLIPLKHLGNISGNIFISRVWFESSFKKSVPTFSVKIFGDTIRLTATLVTLIGHKVNFAAMNYHQHHAFLTLMIQYYVSGIPYLWMKRFIRNSDFEIQNLNTVFDYMAEGNYRN